MRIAEQQLTFEYAKVGMLSQYLSFPPTLPSTAREYFQ